MDIKILYWEINSSSIGLKKLEPIQIQSSEKKKGRGWVLETGTGYGGGGASRGGDLENLWDEKGQGWEAETRTAPQSQQP